jgi:hypothetical protein
VKRSLLLAPIALTCALAAAASPPAPARTPDTFEFQWAGPADPPLWVSARAAADPDSILDWDLLGRERSSFLRGAVEAQQEQAENVGLGQSGAPDLSVRPIPAAECRDSTLSSEDEGAAVSFRNLVDGAQRILRGVVRSVEPGFFTGDPSTLLILEVEEILGQSAPPDVTRIYLAYPTAHFAIGPYRFCHGEQSYLPAAGDRVLFFDALGPMDPDGRFFAIQRRQVFFENRAGGLILPDVMKKDRELVRTSLDTIVSRVRRQLQGEADR